MTDRPCVATTRGIPGRIPHVTGTWATSCTLERVVAVADGGLPLNMSPTVMISATGSTQDASCALSSNVRGRLAIQMEVLSVVPDWMKRGRGVTFTLTRDVEAGLDP